MGTEGAGRVGRHTDRKEEGGRRGGEERAPHPALPKPARGSAGGAGSGGELRPLPRLAGTRGQGLSHHQERGLCREGATEETPQVIRQSAGGAERERGWAEVRAGSWWSRKLHWERVSGLSASRDVRPGANAGTQRGPAAPAAAGAGGGFGRCLALRRAGEQSRQGCSEEPLGDGPRSPADAQRGRRTRAAAGSHCGFPDCPCPRHRQGTQPRDTPGQPSRPAGSSVHPAGISHAAA